MLYNIYLSSFKTFLCAHERFALDINFIRNDNSDVFNP